MYVMLYQKPQRLGGGRYYYKAGWGLHLWIRDFFGINFGKATA